MEDLKSYIRSVKDFPKKGIMFRDITTILKEPEALKMTAQMLFNLAENLDVNKVVGIESRGFIFGSILAERLDVGFVPVRKPGKLPWAVEQESYSLEYGQDTLQIHKDAVKKGQKVLIVDDLLATGGTLQATCRLVEKLGGKVAGILVLIELSFLKGKDKLSNYDFFSLIKYDSE